MDPTQYRRGPFTDPAAPHPFLASPFHRSSELCGTCHDVSNPAFDRVAGADYAPGPLDQKADSVMSHLLMPLERTYSEWKNSAFPAGVYAPDFAGNKSDGIVASCQDCHLRDVSGTGCNDPAAPLRADLPLHDMMGGNAWMPSVVAALYPGETDAAALADGAARAVSMLQKAALVDVAVVHEGDSSRADVTVTNRTGHKLPTGYPEGRRMWLHVVARDEGGTVVYESGVLGPGHRRARPRRRRDLRDPPRHLAGAGRGHRRDRRPHLPLRAQRHASTRTTASRRRASPTPPSPSSAASRWTTTTPGCATRTARTGT